MSNLSPVDAKDGHPLTSSAPSSPRLSPLDAHHAGSPSRAISAAVSDFDVFSYLNDEELYSGQQQIPQQHMYSSSSSSSSSFTFVPQQAGQATAIRRRGSSRSSVLSVVNNQQDDSHGAGHDANHKRDVSSSSAADIGLRGMHTRHSSYAPVSPTYDPVHYASSTGADAPQMRPTSWSQISLDDLQQQRDLHAQAGLYDSPTQANFGWGDSLPIASTSSGSGYPPDLENASDLDNKSSPRRKSTSRRSRAKSAQYKRNADGDSQGLGRRRTMIDNAKRELKRMSVRVVNLNQRNETRHVRIDDDADSEDEAPELPVLASAAGQHQPKERTRPPDPGIVEGTRSHHVPFSQADGPLQGRTVCLFGSKSRIRRAALAVFLWPWTEPLILLLIIANIVILTIQSAPNVYEFPRPAGAGYFHTWEDYALFVLFVLFTIESLARILLSGFILSPRISVFAYVEEVWQRLRTKTSKIPTASQKAVLFPHLGRETAGPKSPGAYSSTQKFDLPPRERSRDAEAIFLKSAPSLKRADSLSDVYPPPQSAPSTVKSFKSTANLLPSQSTSDIRRLINRSATFHEDVPFVRAVQNAREQRLTDQKAYLRHSWNRVDFLAIASFWIMFILALTGVEAKESVYMFRALSVLRAARLLTVTAGTTTILRSLKQSAPLMANVAFFVVFAMTLFSIIGVQAFKGSWQRSCIWIDPDGQKNVSLGHLCGGHVDPTTGQVASSIASGTSSSVNENAKGFICPLGQLCMEGENPNNGLQSFDNILASLLQIVIVTGSNTWSQIMYSMIDAEYMVSSLFFVVCLVLLNFWLMNLFVAVIVDTFGNIREETKQSAFAGQSEGSVNEAADEGLQPAVNRNQKRGASWKRLLGYSRWLWIGVVIADVGIQASKTAGDSENRIRFLNNMELYFTMAFLVEIVTRFMGYFPDYRAFTRSTSNMADSALAVITCIIQTPFIRSSGVYPWLTVFQLMRFYRVILAVPRMKPLIAKLMSSIAGLINMVLFLLLMNFIVAVVAVQYVRGDVPAGDGGQAQVYSFYQVYNSFISIYVVFSSEGWTTILYNAMQYEKTKIQSFISAVFICGWFLFANFILLQLFIAVINEGFAIAEEEKQKAQMTAYMKRYEPQEPVTWVGRWNPYRFVKGRSAKEGRLDQAYPLRQRSSRTPSYGNTTVLQKPLAPSGHQQRASESSSSIFASVHRAFKRPVGSVGMSPSLSAMSLQNADVDRQLALLKYGLKGQSVALEHAEEERLARQAEFIAEHPSYDRSLWIFPQTNILRRFCQRVVEPAHGKRLYGTEPHHAWAAAFRLVILGAIVGSVAIASIATPVYRREYYIENQHIRLTWFNLTEVSLGFLFIVEFFIKVVADGFAFTPNAYLLSIWNLLDFFVLLTLVVNIGTSLSTGSAAVNSFTRSLKAFRALRLINLSSTMRDTFYSVMIVGASKIFDASVLTILYIIPFSIWGQNLFAGLLFSCNDESVLGKTQCVGEYMASPVEWEYLVPRAWQNPQVWSFDSFRSALLILFEIVSLEGWSDVLLSAMSITGKDQQLQGDASQYNSIFFLIYNLVGAIVVLTLFVSCILETFTQRSGQALLTAEQRQWVDLKKLILRQRPAKMPKVRPTGAFREWCYERAIAKHGWWSKLLTTLYLIHVAVLMTQAMSQPVWADNFRDYLFLLLTLFYAFDVIVRLAGLGWRSFVQNGWNLYDVFIVTGTFATTIPILLDNISQTAIQLQKLFLVCIAFKLVQKNDNLNTLFKTSRASLPAIVNVFGLWLTLFLVWAIFFLEVFSLTRWSSTGTYTQNYSTFPRAMLMLSVMSTGEAWNTIMHAYTIAEPLCSPSESYLFDDCGSPAWAFVLFISWNMISMYIFLNMLTGVVVENFSFVFSLFGRVTSVSRDDMRHFKKAWAHYDQSRSGYISRAQLIPFLKRLTGVFDVSIYPPEYRIQNLKSIATNTSSAAFMGGRMVDGLNLPALKAALAQIDPSEVAKRKWLLNRIYYEALLTEDPVKGIAFTNVLLVIAHHKLIDVKQSLQLEDLMLQKVKDERVNDLLDLDRIKGLLQTLYWRRRFLLERPASSHGHTELPAIILDDANTHSPRMPPLSINTGVVGDLLSGRPPDSPLLSPRSVSGRSSSLASTPQRRMSDDEPRSPLLAHDSVWVKVMEEEVSKAQQGQGR